MFSVKRTAENPLLVPVQDNPWETFAAFNWAPVVSKKDPKTVHCVYRAMSEAYLIPDHMLRLSSIGYACSKDGLHYTNRTQLIKPELDWERYGCEDPRVTELNGKFYIFYTALSTFPFAPEGIKVACAVTRDFKNIEEKHLVTPFNAKAMALFPSRINGKIVAVLTVNTDNPKQKARIALAEFDKEEDIWNSVYWSDWYRNLERYAFNVRRTISDHIEVGSAPVKTKHGWLLIYSHIQDYTTANKIFGIEALLLDLKRPGKIIGRTRHPILVPEETYEKYGQTPNVIFPSGALVREKELRIFYGAADTTSCTAEVSLESLLTSMQGSGRAGCVKRYAKNPILSPIPKNPWEGMAVFNPAAIDLEGTVHIIYRAMSHDNTSYMGYAASRNGLKIDKRLTKPIYSPREKFEAKRVPNGNSGCEDPRIVRLGDVLFMCYTAYNGVELPRVALSTIAVNDFLRKRWNWSKPVLITPPGIDDKDACIFPMKINGQYLLIHRIQSQICVDYFSYIATAAEEVTKGIRIMGPRYGMWDSAKIGLAGPPIKTKEGWILFYHGVGEDRYYRMGAALLDLKNPLIVHARTNEAILEPEKAYEKEGQVPNVVFPCAHILRGDTIYHYYGGADSVVAVATTKLADVLAMLARPKLK
ncbi:MAG: hypothetical protein ABH875_03430 [Candidatus Omnitrophota bacterium]